MEDCRQVVRGCASKVPGADPITEQSPLVSENCLFEDRRTPAAKHASPSSTSTPYEVMLTSMEQILNNQAEALRVGSGATAGVRLRHCILPC